MKRIRISILSLVAGAMALLFTQSGLAQTWTGVDLGAPTFAGSVTPGSPTTTILAGGSDIWGTSDSGYFYYTTSEAMVWEATVRVQNLVCPGVGDGAQWAKCELMVRMDQGTGLPTASDAFIASMTTQPSSYTVTFGAAGVNWVVDQFRTAPSGNADWIWNVTPWETVTPGLYTAAGNPAPNYPNRWLRLKRLFSVITVQDSVDGVNWNTSAVLNTGDPNAQPAGNDNGTRFNTPFSGKLFIGVAVTSHDNAVDESNCAVATISDLAFQETVFVDSEPPTAPTNLRTTLVGARRVELAWNPSTDLPVAVPPNPVFYNVYRDGVIIKSAISTTNCVDAPGPDQDPGNQLVPGSAHTYTVEAIDVNLNKSAVATLPVTLLAEVAVPGYFAAQVYTNIPGTALYDWYAADLNYPNSPQKKGWWLTGLSFNQPSGAFGDNYGLRMAGTLTAPKTGQYRFFVRSDDASAFWLNTTTAIPDALSDYPIAQEDDCCDAFAEPGQAENVDTAGVGTGTFPTSAAISLTAGQRYGFLWLVKEGTGGDNGQVAWRMEGDTTAASSLPPIDGVFITPAVAGSDVSDPGGASVTITQEPQDVSVGANAHLTTLWVAATNTSPWGYPTHYQWYKDGAPIMNANATNVYIDVLSAADAGLYKVLVSVPGASTFSREATLAVTNDVTKPTLVDGSAHGTTDYTTVTFRFSEPVTSPTATTAGSYAISGGVTVSAATRVDLYTIRLTTSLQAAGTEYTITVNNVQDNAGNAIEPNSTLAFKSFVAAPLGTANFKLWQYGANPGLDTFQDTKIGYGADPTAPSDPTSSTLVTGFVTPNWANGENYGAVLQGYFIPPTDGDYVFFLTADDYAYLFLSSDENPANKKRICQETAWSNSNQWTNSGGSSVLASKRSDQYASTDWPPDNTPGPIHLLANQRYYLEGLWVEGGGGDGLGATYKLATEADPATDSATRITGNLLQALYPVDPWAGAPVIATHPVDNLTLAPGATATLSVVVGNGARPLSYQWQHNGKNIPGATSPDYTIANASPLDNGQYWVVVSNSVGSTTSGQGSPNPTLVMVTGTGVFNIEAEDFDYASGQSMPEASVMPYVGGAYSNLISSVQNVDYHNTDGTDAVAYRAFPSGQNAQNSSETTGQWTMTRAGEWAMTANYKIGWTSTGDWGNYTRTFPTPAKTYHVFVASSYDGVAANQINGTLGIVTAGVGTTNQTIQNVGTFNCVGSGDWSRNNLVAMTDGAGGDVKTLEIGGTQTLRWQYNSGDADYLIFYPIGTGGEPTISVATNAQGQPVLTYTGTLLGAGAVTGPYTAVAGATSPFTVTGGAGTMQFYRSSSPSP